MPKKYRRTLLPDEHQPYWKITVAATFDTGGEKNPIIYQLENVTHTEGKSIGKICVRNKIGFIVLSYFVENKADFPSDIEEQMLVQLESCIVKQIQELEESVSKSQDATLVRLEKKFLKAADDTLHSPVFRQAKIKLITA